MNSIKNEEFLYDLSNKNIEPVQIKRINNLIKMINKRYQDVFEVHCNIEHILIKFIFYIRSANILMVGSYSKLCVEILNKLNNFFEVQFIKILNSEDIKKINYNKIFLGLLILYHKNSNLNKVFLYFFDKINIKIICDDYLNIILQILDTEKDFFLKYLEMNYKILLDLYYDNSNIMKTIDLNDINLNFEI